MLEHLISIIQGVKKIYSILLFCQKEITLHEQANANFASCETH